MDNALLDQYSYHVFKFMDKAILYDLNTDTICKVDDALTYDILEGAGQFNIVDLREKLKPTHGIIDDQKIFTIINPLKNCGFFISPPPDWTRIDAAKEKAMGFVPSKIQLSIAQCCNLACVYCYAEECGSNARNQLMSFETAKQAVDYLVHVSGEERKLTIQFFGGEPLLNFVLIKKVVDYAKALTSSTKKIFSFALTTNCTLLTDEIQDYLLKHDFGIIVSVDGDEKTHNQQRPFRDGSGSYRLVINNALSLNRKFIESNHRNIKIRANIINGNVKRLAEITEKFTAMGFQRINVSPIVSRPGENASLAFDENAWTEWRQQSDAQMQHWLACIKSDKKIDNPYITHTINKKFNLLKSRRLFGGLRCGAGHNVNTVDVDGNIFPCHRYPGLNSYIIGNVHTGIDREKLSRYYDGIMNEMLKNCSTCWMRVKCGGPCPWQVSSKEGKICPSDKLSCQDRKYAFMQAAYLYVSLSQDRPDALAHIL